MALIDLYRQQHNTPTVSAPPPRHVTPGSPAGHDAIEAAVHRAIGKMELAVNVGFDDRAKKHIAKFVTKHQVVAGRFPTSVGSPDAHGHYVSPGTPMIDAA